jgi:hypothetical protein
VPEDCTPVPAADISSSEVVAPAAGAGIVAPDWPKPCAALSPRDPSSLHAVQASAHATAMIAKRLGSLPMVFKASISSAGLDRNQMRSSVGQGHRSLHSGHFSRRA